MTVADIFLILIFTTMLVFGFLAFLVWQKISVFLTYNTLYQGADYQQEVTRTKLPKVHLPPKKTETKGRAVKDVPDMVDLADVDPELGMEAVERLASGN